jgi:hypothetical protein
LHLNRHFISFQNFMLRNDETAEIPTPRFAAGSIQTYSPSFKLL